MKKLLSTTLIALGLLAGAVSSAQAQNAAAGEKKAAMCIGCHGIPDYKASFPEVYRVPKISGQNAKYIVGALTAYKKGDRHHPTMHAIATSLSEQDMADLAAFYSTHGIDANDKAPAQLASPPEASIATLITKGACASCHGANFSTPIDPSYPKLAGQHPDYLYMALKEYATPGAPLYGRNHPIMGAQVKAFTHPELQEIAKYIAAQPGELKTVQQAHFRFD